MSEWECGVCGYLHAEEEPPEKCPVCDAPAKMFIQKEVKTEEQNQDAEPEVAAETLEKPSADIKTNGVKKWRCTVCGYIHTGDEPPEKCPVCLAPAAMFEPVIEEEDIKEKEKVATPRHRCTVCGYLHSEDQPPESCPVCGAKANMFVEVDAKGRALSNVTQDSPAPQEKVPAVKKTLMSRLGDLALDLHLHPITVHFPNGILPVVVGFLLLSVFMDIISLGEAAWYNLIAVLLMLPPVLLTGFLEWQKRYRGAKTPLFIVKIFCAVVVLGAVNVLVFWRLLDPGVLGTESPYRNIYLVVAGIMLAAAGIAGHLGGKLVFGARK